MSTKIDNEDFINSPMFKAFFVPHFIPHVSRIPKDVHLVEYNDFYPLYKYISLLTVVEVVKPDNIYMHCIDNKCGHGKWWDLAKRFVKCVEITYPTREIHGHKINVMAHATDVVRMKSIYNQGGIYLDSDVMMIKPIDSLLELGSGQTVVAPWEYDGSTLGASVFAGVAGSPFIRRWMDTYRFFNDDCWACHAITVPGLLAQVYPSEARMLDHRTFLEPLWTDPDKIFGNGYYDFTVDNYGMHLWCSAGNCQEHLLKITSPADLNKYSHTT